MAAGQNSDSVCFLEFLQQRFISSQGKGQRSLLIELGVELQVLDHIGEEVGTLHGTTRRVVAQGGEMHMEMVVGWVVMEVNPQLGSSDAKALHYCFLVRGKK